MSRRYLGGRNARPPVDPLLEQHPANDSIRVPNVRLIDQDGNNTGIVETRTALSMARAAYLDLVIISQAATPPIAKITDHNKFIFQQKQQRKDQERKNRENQIVTKEIQLRPVTSQHDLEVKRKHALQWLNDRNKIKIVMRFKGREQAHADMGLKVMQAFIATLGECKIEQDVQLLGRNATAILAPLKA